MSSIEWKVGDTGVTRDGSGYEVRAILGADDRYPIHARIYAEVREGLETFSETGSYYGDATRPYGLDLMPPTGHASTDTPQPQPVDRAALVELSGRVLVALVGRAAVQSGMEPEEAGRWAVDAARALLRECEA